LTKILGVYFAWMFAMIGAGVAGDLLGSPALLSFAAKLALAMPLMVGGVAIALILLTLFGKDHEN
jgi:hypothetical protein